MKTLLIQSPDDPISTNYHKFLMPLSLGTLVSYLRKNNLDVKAYDLNFNIIKNYDKSKKELCLKIYDKDFFVDCINNPDRLEEISDLFQYVLEGINVQEYDFVGISTGTKNSLFEVHFAFLLGKLIKTKYNKPVVFGGLSLGLFAINNLFAELIILLLKNFKYIIFGPGERSLVSLLQSYENGTIDEVYPTLKGAKYLSGGIIEGNNMDQPTFTCPDYSDFNADDYKIALAGPDEDENIRQIHQVAFPFNVGFYNYLNAHSHDKTQFVNVIPYYFNINCWYNCAFCAQSDKSLKPMTKEVNEVINDIIYLQKQYKTKYFFFLNNAINFTPAFLKEFCNLIINKGIKIYWSDCARFNGMTKELVELMHKAGCRKLVFGFETGSEKILKYIDKKLDLNHASDVLKWCKEAGIFAEIEVIVGLPYEYDEDFEETYSFVMKHMQYLNFVHSTAYYVLQNSLMGRYPEKYGIEFVQKETHESVLAWIKELSKNEFKWDPKDAGKTPNHVLKFNELNGRKRSHEIIEKETHAKYMKMFELNTQFPGCTELFKIKHMFKSRVSVNV